MVQRAPKGIQEPQASQETLVNKAPMGSRVNLDNLVMMESKEMLVLPEM